MLGQGGFGTVSANGDKAVKTFKRLEHLVTEVFVTKYCSENSHHVVQVRGCSFRSLTMSTTRWHSSLDKLIYKGCLTTRNKASIHKCILKALVHLEALHIVHADVKPANVLVSADFMSAVLADFGISSASNSARVRQTSAAFSIKEDKAVSHRTHDLFSFVLLTLELFYGYRVRVVVSSRKNLRDICARIITDKKTLDVMHGLIQDDELKCWTAKYALKTLYGEKVTIPSPEFTLLEGVGKRTKLQVASVVQEASEVYKIGKVSRFEDCCVLLSGSVSVPPERLDMYMYTLMFVFACVFGHKSGVKREDRMSVDDIMTATQCTREEVNGFLNTLISIRKLVTLMFAP